MRRLRTLIDAAAILLMAALLGMAFAASPLSDGEGDQADPRPTAAVDMIADPSFTSPMID